MFFPGILRKKRLDFLFFLGLERVERGGKKGGKKKLTGPPLAPSCSLTFTMSMGWMMVVAAIPESPPLTKGLAVAQAPAVAGLASVIFF